MRIISGRYKGRIINPPRGFKARPTTDFAKESLFNILENTYDFESITALDLFAGTGGISYELASRGCLTIESVEIYPLHFSFIKRTAQELGFKQIHAIRNDAFKFLHFCTSTYDIIFADPPYDFEGIDEIAFTVFARNLLNKNGMLILEHSNGKNFAHVENYKYTRNYGGVNFSFFQ
jgi:16S rRNA (guanine(966)-N(2))-methyltransferase RsmD